jgi:methylmalonyl-CoA/ethylmalonyl-CoA epimerase
MPEPNLHHVGYVVADIEKSIPAFAASLAADWDGNIFHDPLQKVRVAFLSTRPGDPQIELVQPASPDAPVMRFLEQRSGGLHHICYEVDDLQSQLVEMKERRALIAKRPKPAVAFGGRPIAWVLTAEKLLIEYLERAREGTSR